MANLDAIKVREREELKKEASTFLIDGTMLMFSRQCAGV